MLHRLPDAMTTYLPFLTAELPGIGGVLRTTDEDFAVDEVPAYPPAGTGDHVFVRIEKRGLTTPQAVEQLARAVGVAPRDVGVAGMKDRHAVTRQWVSLPPPVTPEQLPAVTLNGATILEASRHPHKLRTGHVRANRFAIVVRGVAPDAADRARAISTESPRRPAHRTGTASSGSDATETTPRRAARSSPARDRRATNGSRGCWCRRCSPSCSTRG